MCPVFLKIEGDKVQVFGFSHSADAHDHDLPALSLNSMQYVENLRADLEHFCRRSKLAIAALRFSAVYLE